MAYSIQNIKSQLVGGGARACLFKVTFNYPEALGAASGEKLQFMCKASQIPASSVTKLTVDYDLVLTHLDSQDLFMRRQVTLHLLVLHNK